MTGPSIGTGIAAAMSRISAIREIAGQAGGGFAGALGTAVAAHQPAVAPVQATVPSRTTWATAPGPTEPPASTAPAPATPATAATGTPRPLPPEAARWQASIERAAGQEGVDPRLLTAVVWVESGFRPDAVSHAGAIGLAQLMPATADLLGVDPYDPDQNLAGGARFLRSMLDQFGRVDLALAAYNAGPARVSSLHDGGPGVPVSADYVATVLDRYRSLGGTP